MSSFRTKAPFGASRKRFQGGIFDKKGGVGPAHYKIKDIRCITKTNNQKESWTRKIELEEYSKSWGYKNMNLLALKTEEAKRGGPGHYELTYHLQKKCEHNVYDNFSFGTSKRFKTAIRNTNPGPGSYGIPQNKIERNQKPFRQWTPVPYLEWGGSHHVGNIRRSWELPCNRYDIAVNEVASITKKVVSKRGPYDLFTGPRDNSTIKGYFTTALDQGAKIWPRTLPHCFDYLLFSKYKSKTGKFFKSERFPDIKKRGGMTDYYNLNKRADKTQNLFAFNSSVAYARPVKAQDLQPGPGRYENKSVKCKITVPEMFKRTWQFKSKTGRTKYEAIQYNNF